MTNANTSEKDLENKLNLACEVADRRLTTIWGAVDSIDTKINIVIGFASTILVLLAGFFSLGDRAWPIPSLILFALALLAYIILAIISILAYRVRPWSYRPDVATLLQHCENKEYTITQMKTWLAEECNKSCYDNLNELKRKAKLTNWGLAILATETTLLVLGLACAFSSI
jgi:hypothetical protein